MTIRIRIISNGEERIHEMRDHETVVVVGRKNKCDIVLDEEPRASRQHFRIEKDGDGYLLLDLDSANGTQVNGKTAKRVSLELGDKIAVGSTVLYFGEPVPVKKVPSRRPASSIGAAAAVGRPASNIGRPAMSAERRAELEAARLAAGNSGFIKNLFIAATALLVVGIGGMVMWKAINPPPSADGTVAETPSSQDAIDQSSRQSEKARILEEFYAVETSDADIDEQLATINALYDRYATAPFAAELKAIRDNVLESVGNRVQRKLEHLIADGTEYARRQYRYGDVLDALTGFAEKYGHEKYQPEKWLPTYETARKKLIADAETFFEGTLVWEANDLIRGQRLDDAISVYENAKRQNFRGFRTMGARCDERIGYIKAVIENVNRGQGQGESVERSLEDATRTSRQRIKREEPGDTTARPDGPTQPDPEAMVDRGAEQKMLAALYQKFLDACNRQNGAKLKGGTIQYRGESAPVSGASDSGIKIYRQGIEILVKWERVKPEMQLSGYRDISGLTVDDLWAIAVYAHRHGMLAEAESTLYEVWEKDNSRKAQIDLFVARIKSKPVPAGGFIPWKLKGKDGVFITPTEKEEWEVARKIDELVGTIDDNIGSSSASAKDRVQQAVTELSKYGEEARRRGVQIIEEKKEQLMNSIAKKGFGSNGQLDELKKKLDEARKEALEFIYDEQKYPYPNKSAEAQAEVDELVQKVRDIWENPASEVAIPGNIQKDVDAVRDLIEIAKQIDPDGQVVESDAQDKFLDWVRSLANKKLSIQNYSKDSGERQMYANGEQIERDNNEGDSCATAEERQHVSILNKYRLMMGHPALRINPKLTMSARRHSEYMKSSGQFAHQIPGHPDGESPSDRANKQGYSGGGAENIAMAGRGHTPYSAFDAWFHSAGHHRNMLHPKHKVIGAGSAGSHWTQQFGPREDGSEPKAGN